MYTICYKHYTHYVLIKNTIALCKKTCFFSIENHFVADIMLVYNLDGLFVPNNIHRTEICTEKY